MKIIKLKFNNHRIPLKLFLKFEHNLFILSAEKYRFLNVGKFT